MEWLVQMLIAHRRLRGLTVEQLQELIRTTDSIPALKLIKEHLERGDFRYRHVEADAPALIDQCVQKAKELIWERHADDIKRGFLEHLGDPFGGAG